MVYFVTLKSYNNWSNSVKPFLLCQQFKVLSFFNYTLLHYPSLSLPIPLPVYSPSNHAHFNLNFSSLLLFRSQLFVTLQVDHILEVCKYIVTLISSGTIMNRCAILLVGAGKSVLQGWWRTESKGWMNAKCSLVCFNCCQSPLKIC